MVGKKFPTSYNESMNTVIFQECIRYNRLLSDMASSLQDVQKALVGEVVMSEALDKLASSLYINQVPKMWADKGFLSLKPLGSWVEDLLARIHFLNEWIEGGTPKVFWISGFFFPQAFFTATLQNYARKHIIAVDLLSFNFVIKDNLTHKDIHEKPDDGVFAWGMYLEGC